MQCKVEVLYLVSFLLIIVNVKGQSVGESCVRKYDDSPGKCTAVRDCKQARDDHRKGIPLTVCGYSGREPIICCPVQVTITSTSSLKRISELKCEEYAKHTFYEIEPSGLTLDYNPTNTIKISKCNISTGLIVGGMKTKNGEFPHMAAIGWELSSGAIDFKCGGSLISERFVMTAAHCIQKRDPPTMVRLGDQNIYSKNDGLQELDVKILKTILHEKYERGNNDIAILELARTVKFTDYIRPACLWQRNVIDSEIVAAAGWGKVVDTDKKGSEDLMRVNLNIIGNQECQRLWREGGIPSFTISDTQMCAGDKKGGKDTCGGDSGGPIMFTRKDNNCLFYIVGVTSFGIKECSRQGYAGVYSRVSSYIDWIERKVWS